MVDRSCSCLIVGPLVDHMSRTVRGCYTRCQDYLGDQAAMRQFQDLVSNCNLLYIPYVGSVFTWWNKRVLNPVGKKLDRALINGDWLRVFPQSYAKFDAGGVSDHARCMVTLTKCHVSTRKPFKFFNFLIENEELKPLFARKWAKSEPLHHSRMALHQFTRN